MTQAKTYQLDVEGVGQFEVRRFNTMSLRVAVEVAVERKLDGLRDPSPELRFLTEAIAKAEVLVVKWPDGLRLDDLDPMDNDSFRKIVAINSAIDEKERFFRGVLPVDREAGSEGDRGEPGAVVPADLQSGAQRPAVSGGDQRGDPS